MSTPEWLPGEDARYAPCGHHENALARLDFDDAFGRAVACEAAGGDYTTEIRNTNQGEPA